MNYSLNNTKNSSTFSAIKKFSPMLKGEGKNMSLALVALLINTATSLIAPLVIGQAINTSILKKDYHGVFISSLILLSLYILGFITSYFQTKLMGSVGQRLLYNLRNKVFLKLQQLPIAFFNQNKAGDLISRINNDTDKLNQFFSQGLLQFIGSIFMMTGAAIFMVVLQIQLGLAALIPAVLILVITWIVTPWVKSKNAINLKAIGGMSAEISYIFAL